ncbi:MAG: T9SS type A sorting domain-containing protein [Ekhidna sp.]|nr:T9SS type A sorting domain-containing protein [Ekhidna sp.]
MRLFLKIVFTVFALQGIGQLTLKPIQKVQKIQKIENIKGRTSELTLGARFIKNTLPFWDDFSITPNGTPDSVRIWGMDTTRQWNLKNSRGVFVNSTLAINPPSYRVVTFDGLDANGQFYGEEQGLTDQLVSDTLELGLYNEADELYLSFYWQAGGNVERPDEGDSLILELYNLSEDEWETVWSMDGSQADTDFIFYQEAIRLEQRFITDTAMFRFSSYGDQNGPFDAWHLDWIYLNGNRAADDFFYQDVSVNSEISILFDPFRSVPLNQIDLAGLPASVEATSMNLNEEPDRIGLNLKYILKIIDLETKKSLFSGVELIEDLTTFFNSDPLVIDAVGTVTYENVSLSGIPSGDSVVLQALISIDTTNIKFLDNSPVNLRVNDTIRTQYLLQDFYAYDDGTAEYAVGTNILGGQVGVQYWVNQPDTLTHIDIHFPNIVPSSDGRAIILKIFNDLEDSGPLISQAITINTANDINQFERYQLDRSLIVSDTFFITYEQNINEFIGIGFDRSNPEASGYIFEALDDQWVRNKRLRGAIMIRPVFKSGLDLVLGSGKDEFDNYSIYPNPADEFLKVSGDYQKIEIRNLSGQLILAQEKQEVHDLSTLDMGLYLVFIYNDLKVVTRKLIKR